jgi:hypothetical protein
MYFLDRNNDSLDTWVFVGIFVTGVITQIIGRLIFDAPAILIIFILISYLVGYAYLVYQGTYTKISRSMAADNFYYMGFLFTISSLAIALYKFGQPTEQSQEATLRIIVADLGIGLSTTIVGLLLRTAFTQFRNAPEEIEDRVTITLKQRAKEVESNFLIAIKTFESTNVRLQELTKRTEENIQIVLEDFPERVAYIHDILDQSINEAIETFTSRLTDKLENVSELNLPVDEINSKWRSVISAMDQLELPPDILKNKFDEALEEIDKFIKRVENLNINIDMDELNKLLIKQSEQISNIDIPTSTLKNSFDDVIQQLKNFENKLNNLKLPDDLIIKASETIVGELSGSVSSVSKNITAELESAKDSLVKTMQNKEVQINNAEISPAKSRFNIFK